MSTLTMDNLDTRLLTIVQEEFPMVPRPYAAIARQLEVAEAVVLDRLTELHAGPRAPIRQIGAIFDSKSLGYQSTLVAAKVPEDQLPKAVTAINTHPGVSHNYRRDHAYNLWFTLAVAPDSKLGLETTATILQRRAGATAMRLLPTLKLYKIGVKLNLGNKGDTPAFANAIGRNKQECPPYFPYCGALGLTEYDKKIIRVLQRDLPIVANPFDAAAEESGISVVELLQEAEKFRAVGIMRRFSAVLRHRELGFDANAMGVWVVPPDRQDSFGRTAAGFPEVSHCYLRPSYEDWPYTIFTMIHTQDRARATEVLTAISAATGVGRYTALYSTHEYKKVRVQYFTDDAKAWEAEAGSSCNGDTAEG